MPNLLRHVSNIKNVYGLPCVVAVNRFPTDTERELALVIDECRRLGVNTVLSEVWAKGGEGGEELAREVVRLCDEESNFNFAYNLDCHDKRKNRAGCEKGVRRRRHCAFSERGKADKKA